MTLQATSSATDNTTASANFTPNREVVPAPRLRQVFALAKAEAAQLIKNKVALLNCFGMPLLLALIFSALGMGSGAALGTLLPAIVIGTSLLFVVYYTVVTAFVARRESRLLKRLRAGEAGDVAILAGIVAPYGVLALAQSVLAYLAVVLLFGVSVSPWALLVPLAAALGAISFGALAIASTTFTKTVEHAQVTTMPMLLIPLLFSGLSLPLAMLPEVAAQLALLLPLTPVVDLVMIGVGGVDVLGRDASGAAAFVGVGRDVAVLLAWTAVGAWYSARTLTWEPRS